MTLYDFLDYFLKPSETQMRLDDDHWVNAVPLGAMEPLSSRLRGAWRVLRGKAWHVDAPCGYATDISPSQPTLTSIQPDVQSSGWATMARKARNKWCQENP